MDLFSINAYSPAVIAKRLQQASLSKCTNDPFQVLALAVLSWQGMGISVFDTLNISGFAGQFTAGDSG